MVAQEEGKNFIFAQVAAATTRDGKSRNLFFWKLTQQFGNRTEVGGTWARTGLPQSVASATYDAANQMLTFGSQTLTYDANGNLASDGSKTYTWTARNQLVSMTGAGFGYDGLGRRLHQTVGGPTTDFLYDGVNPVQELSGGTPTANLLTGLGIDEFFTRTDSAGTRSFLSDALGSTVALTDSAGAVQTEYTYEPFGKTTASGPASTNPFQFTGRENDETGLYYYRARYHAPGLHRFLSADPTGFAAGDPNLYAYVGNNPMRFADPYGTFAVNAAAAGIGAAIGASVALTSTLLNNPNASLGQLATAVGIGALQGATLGITFGSSTALNLVAGAAIGGLSDVIGQLVTTGSFEIISATLGAAGGATGTHVALRALAGGASAGRAAALGGALSSLIELLLKPTLTPTPVEGGMFLPPRLSGRK